MNYREMAAKILELSPEEQEQPVKIYDLHYGGVYAPTSKIDPGDPPIERILTIYVEVDPSAYIISRAIKSIREAV